MSRTVTVTAPKKPAPKCVALENSSDKSFGDYFFERGKWWVELKAKATARNKAMRKDAEILKLLHNPRVGDLKSHPGRHRIIDFLRSKPGTDFIPATLVVELIEPFGFDLMTLMIKQNKSKHKMSLASLAHYFCQICDGIDYMHKLGIIHGDLKLQQVLVTPSGDMKITDFGYAARIGENASFPAVHYMCPEVETADGRPVQAHPAIDIFSLGYMLGQLTLVLADGEKPRVAETRMSMVCSDPAQRMSLSDVMRQTWLSHRHVSDKLTTTANSFNCHCVPSCFAVFWSAQPSRQATLSLPTFRMKGFAMRVTKREDMAGTIGNAGLMQKGIQVLYVDRRNRVVKSTPTGPTTPRLFRVSTTNGSAPIEKVPGANTEIKLDDWIYFGHVGGEKDVYREEVEKAMHPDKEFPNIFPVHLFFSGVELPKEAGGFALGPSPKAVPKLKPLYDKLTEVPRGFLNLRNECGINLAGVCRNGTIIPYPGAEFVIRAGDIGLFVQATDLNGHQVETHNSIDVQIKIAEAVRAGRQSS